MVSGRQAKDSNLVYEVIRSEYRTYMCTKILHDQYRAFINFSLW
jgi:hypothetical protein